MEQEAETWSQMWDLKLPDLMVVNRSVLLQDSRLERDKRTGDTVTSTSAHL